MPKIVITSGGTREYIDDVRYITNVSTGSLGAKIADVFAKNNWQVTLIHGVDAKIPKSKVNLIPIVSAKNAQETILDYITKNKVDVIIHLMAVADYAPYFEDGKISSNKNELVIKCYPTQKILPEIKKISSQSLVVSFKLEKNITIEELRKRGINSLQNAKADYVVINDLTNIDTRKHHAEILDKRGNTIVSLNNKSAIANALFDLLQKRNL